MTATNATVLITTDDATTRCSWATGPEINIEYHDREWGRPMTDERRLLEKVCLEGFQAGLSWITILRKREAFRSGFADFDAEAVSRFGDGDVSRLMADAGIVRHEGKIRSAINNARRALELSEEQGSLAAYFWGWADPDDPPPTEWVPHSATSAAMSRDLKKRGWTFVGPTTVYAFMQAAGLVNDHVEGCHVRDECSRLRASTLAGY
jgi:DNA-3-methyladenine glycosylase I